MEDFIFFDPDPPRTDFVFSPPKYYSSGEGIIESLEEIDRIIAEGAD